MKDIPTADLQTELDQLVAWFESDAADLDEAVLKYQRAQDLLVELESRLKSAENIIKKITKA